MKHPDVVSSLASEIINQARDFALKLHEERPRKVLLAYVPGDQAGPGEVG